MPSARPCDTENLVGQFAGVDACEPERSRRIASLPRLEILRARDAIKMRVVAGRLAELFRVHGWPAFVTTFAAKVGLACRWAARGALIEPATRQDALREGPQADRGPRRRSIACSNK